MNNKFKEGSIVEHPAYGVGVYGDSFGAKSSVNFKTSGFKSCHTRLLKTSDYSLQKYEEIKPIELNGVVYHKWYGKGILEQIVDKKSVVLFDVYNRKTVKNSVLSSTPILTTDKYILDIREKDLKIRTLFDLGFTVPEIAKKLKIPRKIIHYIVKYKFGIDFMKGRKEAITKLMSEVKVDLYHNQLSYSDIITKHKLTEPTLNRFISRGFSLFLEFLKIRNNKMGLKYKNGEIAKRLTSNDKKHIKSVTGVFGVVSNKLGIYKYPTIKRGYSGLFQDKRVVNIIKSKKKLNKLTNQEIADLLNRKGLLTTTGKQFKWFNVNNIYSKVLSGTHKIKKNKTWKS